jgi:hypothetical protein
MTTQFETALRIAIVSLLAWALTGCASETDITQGLKDKRSSLGGSGPTGQVQTVFSPIDPTQLNTTMRSRIERTYAAFSTAKPTPSEVGRWSRAIDDVLLDDLVVEMASAWEFRKYFQNEDAYIAGLYAALLGDPKINVENQKQLAEDIRKGVRSRSSAVRSIIFSNEFFQKLANEAYQRFMKQEAPSDAGALWLARANDGVKLKDLWIELIAGNEYAKGSAANYLTSVFADLLGRAPSAKELSDATAYQLLTEAGRAQHAQSVLESGEFMGVWEKICEGQYADLSGQASAEDAIEACITKIAAGSVFALPAGRYLINRVIEVKQVGLTITTQGLQGSQVACLEGYLADCARLVSGGKVPGGEPVLTTAKDAIVDHVIVEAGY